MVTVVLLFPNLDGGPGGSTQPLPVRADREGVDSVGVVQGVQVLAALEIPEQGLDALAARATKRAVRGHSDGVQAAGVVDVVGLQLVVGLVLHLDILAPASGHDDGDLVVGRGPHAGDPVLVVILLNSVLALGKSVPQPDGLVLAADTICLLSAEKVVEGTSLVGSSNLRVVLPVDRSHSLKVLSQGPDRAKWPS